MDTPARPTGSGARVERAALCDLLARLGPDQPTMCGGWTTRDLAAHLVVRERRPLTIPGLVLPPFAGYTDRVRRRFARRPFPDLVELLRQPPRWSPARVGWIDQAVNSLELFIHHEDVRRARPDWAPRPLPAGFHRLLWSRVRPYARLRLRRFPAPVVIQALGYGQVRVGHPSGPAVGLTGDPGELAIFLTGRQRVARVALSGPAALTGRLSAARLGL